MNAWHLVPDHSLPDCGLRKKWSWTFILNQSFINFAVTAWVIEKTETCYDGVCIIWVQGWVCLCTVRRPVSLYTSRKSCLSRACLESFIFFIWFATLGDPIGVYPALVALIVKAIVWFRVIKSMRGLGWGTSMSWIRPKDRLCMVEPAHAPDWPGARHAACALAQGLHAACSMHWSQLHTLHTAHRAGLRHATWYILHEILVPDQTRDPAYRPGLVWVLHVVCIGLDLHATCSMQCLWITGPV